jgi:hypothetical protein
MRCSGLSRREGNVGQKRAQGGETRGEPRTGQVILDPTCRDGEKLFGLVLDPKGIACE